MLRHSLLLLLWLVPHSGCLPDRRVSTTMARSPVWTQPGSDRVIVWTYRERVRESRGLTDSRENWESESSLKWERRQYGIYDHVRVSVVDPVTGAATTLDETSFYFRPVYWSETTQTLWVERVENQKLELVPITRTGRPKPTLGELQHHRWSLPSRFARSLEGTLVDLETERSAAVSYALESGTLQGSTLLLRDDDSKHGKLTIRQRAVDWSTPTPTVIPGPTYELPSAGDKSIVLQDGRRVAEVVTLEGRTSLVVHDLVTKGRVASIPLEGTEVLKGRQRYLFNLGPELLFLWGASNSRTGRGRCIVGFAIALDSKTVTAIPDSLCVTKVVNGDVHWLVADTGRYYVDRAARFVLLGATDDPLELGPSTIFYTVRASGGGLDVMSVDSATGTPTKIGHHDNAKDTLVNVLPDKQIWASGEDEIVTEMSGKPPIRIKLPSIPPHSK